MSVHLIGVGLGDPAFLTSAAVEAIAAAEVIVYDRPSMGAIVAQAPAEAEIHCVGRRPGGRALGQEEVNRLLIELGRERPVVRIKSGDAFVASRGGEEARALVAAGIPVEITAGVSAAIGAPAAAGIPLMVRQMSVTVTIVDGNVDPEHGEPPRWDAIARLGGTIVVLTGRGRIRRIAGSLTEAGLAPDTPIAAISAAGREQQQVLRGTLGELPAPLPPPVTFVIGQVAALDLRGARAPAEKGTHAHS